MVPVSAKVATRSNRMFSALRALLLTGLAFAALPHSVGAQYFPANSVPQTFDDQTTSGVVMLGREDGLLGPYGNTGYFGPYLHLSHVAGDGPGYRDNGYSTLGLFVPKPFLHGALYTEGRLSVNDFGNMLGSMGAGYRHFSPEWNRTIGGSFWYDIDSGHNSTFSQIGFGLETRGENWDMFANFYLPVRDDDQQFRRTVTASGVNVFNFQGQNLAVNSLNLVTQQVESAMKGFDTEFGGPLPFLGQYGIRGYGGFYHYYKDSISNINGGKFRVQASLTDSLTGQFMLTHDDQFDTSVVFSIALALPGSGASRSRVASPGMNRVGRTVVRAQSPTNGQSVSQWSRMFEPTQRSSRVFVLAQTTQTLENNFNVLTDPATGQPVRIFHLDSRAAAGGDGSFESPFSTPQEAEAGTGPEAIVFAHAGSVFDNGANNFVTLQANQRFLGEGVTHLINTDQLGSIAIPASGDVGGLPTFQGGGGGANMANVTVADGSTFSGFNINNSVNSAVLANNTLTGTANVENTIITGADIGLNVQDATGILNFATTSTINNTIQAGLNVDGAMTTGTINVNGAINNNAARAVRINNLPDGGVVNVNGLVTDNGGTGILVQNTSGDVNFVNANLTIPNGDAVTLTNNQLATIQFNNLDITTAAGGGLIATDSGNVIVGDGSINATGGAAIFIDPTLVNLRFDNVTSINSPTFGIRLEETSGLLSIGGTATITTPQGRGIEFVDSSANFIISTLNVTGSNAGGGANGNAVFLQDTSGAGADTLTGSFVVGGGLVQQTANGSDTFRVDSGSATVDFGANINHGVAVGNNNALVNIFNTTSGNVDFSGTLDANAGTGLQFNNADSNSSFTGTTTLDGGNAGVDILGGSSGTFNFAATTSITARTADAFVVSGNNVDAPTVTYSGTIVNALNNAIRVENTGAAGSVTFNSAVGDAITDTGTGIFLNNVGQDVNVTADTELTGAEGIDIDGGSGTFTFTDTDITNVTGVAAIEINGGTSNINFQADSSATKTAGAAQSLINVTNGHNGTMTYAGTGNATIDDGLQFNDADGTYNFTGTVTLNGGDAGIDILNGSSGTFTFADTTITSPTGTALNVDASFANVNFQTNSSITQTANNAIAVNVNDHSVGTVDVDGTVTATNGTGLQFNDADGIYRFDGTTVLNGGDAGVDILAASAGTFTFTDTTITNPTGVAFNIDASSANVNFETASSITQTANVATAVNINDHTAGALVFDGDVTATTGLGMQFNNADGSYDFDGTNSLTGGTAGIDILGGSNGAFVFAATTNIGGRTAAAFVVSGDNTATPSVTYTGTIANSSNDAIRIENTGNGGTITFDSLAADAIADSGTGTGIFLNGAGSTINFTADMELTGTEGIDIDGGDGTYTFSDTDINATGVSFDVSGGTSSVSFLTNSTINQATNNAALNVLNHGTGTLDFNGDVTTTLGPGVVFNNADGNYSLDGTTTLAGGGSIDILTASSGNFTFGTTSITSAAGDAINIDGHTIGTVTFGNTTIDMAGATGIAIANSSGDYNFTGAANVISNLANAADGVQVTEAAGTLVFQNFTIGQLSAGRSGFNINTDNGGNALNLTLSSNRVDLNGTNSTGYSVIADGAGNNVTFSGSNGAANDNVTQNDGAGTASNFQELNGGLINGTIRINGTDLTP
ncbi:MAG: hypothetical protein HOL01_04595 [Planctomycetaceae bacterium]|nr:hypothetical protein [Planctomycetaceae bacterium]